MSLAHRLLNNPSLIALTTPEEREELHVIGTKPAGRVILKRTFDMCGMKFWRVMGPEGHPNYHSDLSVQGLKDWGIIR